jgi:hypothetical protein
LKTIGKVKWRRSFALWLVGSLVIACAGFAAGSFGMTDVSMGAYAVVLVPTSLTLGLVWFLGLPAAVGALGWRAFWLLVGTPLALFWPVVVIFFAPAIANCGKVHSGDWASWLTFQGFW